MNFVKDDFADYRPSFEQMNCKLFPTLNYDCRRKSRLLIICVI